MDRPHVWLAGGRTGGHLYPGIAVADEIKVRLPECKISFCLQGTPWEQATLRDAGYPINRVASGHLRNDSRMRSVVDMVKGCKQALHAVRQSPPNVVIGLGGYSSVPTLVAAVLDNRPIVLLEQNAVPGDANRMFSPFAQTVCISFAQSRPYLLANSVELTGNPVRRSLQDFRTENASPPTMLVVGGSQGSTAVNEIASQAICELSPLLEGWNVVHQSGSTSIKNLCERYDRSDAQVNVQRYLPDIAWHYARATVVVCRAGATTLAELAATGLPAVLIPYPHARGHQVHNALALQRCGAAEVVLQHEDVSQSVTELTSVLSRLLTSPQKRSELSRQIAYQARPQAAAQVATRVLRLISERCDKSASSRYSPPPRIAS